MSSSVGIVSASSTPFNCKGVLVVSTVAVLKKNIEYCPIASELLVTNSQSLKASP